MKLRETFFFELAYQFRRLWTWLIFGALLAFSIFMTRDGTLSEALFDDFFINSPFAIAKTTITGCLIWLLAAAMISGEAAARDVATGMHALTYSVPVKKWQYLGGKFLAALFINALIMLTVLVGIILAVYLPGVDPKLIGPFRISAYFTAYALLAIPNIFTGTAIQFALALKTGRPMAAYLGSVFLFFMSYILGLFLFLQGRRELANLLDPIGVHFILSDLSHLWTPTEKSWRLISLEGTVLYNRSIWTCIGIITLAFAYLTFQFKHHVVRTFHFKLPLFGSRRNPPNATLADLTKQGVQPSLPVRPSDPTPAPGFPERWYQLLVVAWSSFRFMAVSWAGLALLVAIPMLTVLVVIDQMESNGVPLLPSTVRVISELTMPISAEFSRWIIVPLFLIFFAGELVWKERDARVDEIADAMPVPEWVPLLGKLMGVALLLVLLMAVLATVGVSAQLILNYREIDLTLYVKVLFGLQFGEYLLLSVLFVALHVLVNQKYIGHLAAIFAFVVITLAPMFGLEHNLLIYGGSPGWTYTEMQGFADSIMPWLWFKMYWASWAVLLVVVGRLLWVRGKGNSTTARMSLARRRLDQPTILITSIASGLVLSSGAFIFYNTNVLNEYISTSGAERRQAEYERRYSKYADVPQPEVTHAKLNVEIYPRQRKVDIQGSYRLVNNTNTPLDTILVSEAQDAEYRSINFNRPASPVVVDKEHVQRVYVLAAPLQPNDSVRINFHVHVKARGFGENGSVIPVTENGSTFSIRNWLPGIGYQKQREIIQPAHRRRLGLAERPLIASLYDPKARFDRGSGTVLESIIGTTENQTAIAPGNLRRTWIQSGRRYFHYRTDGPVGSEWAFFSAVYSTREAEWKNPENQAVLIRIFHHPAHTAHVERILQSATASLDYYSRNFGAYPYGYLSIVERPGNGTGMHADPAMIVHGEGFTQWNPKNDQRSLDLPYAILAHEMGHQWTVPYAAVEGAPVMSESVAWYYGMKAIEHSRGPAQLRRLLRFMRQPHPYPPIRRGEPLLRGLDPYLSYRRGPFALYAMSEYVGEQRINRALKQMLETHRVPSAPLATTLDLYRELRNVTPDSLHYLLHDLFEVNTYWDLRTERAISKETHPGNWEVTLDISARKVVTDSAGVEVEVPMNDWIELGIVTAAKDADGDIIYRQKHRIRTGRQTIVVSVSRPPARAGIDPWHLMVDLNLEDNTATLEKSDL